MIYNSLVDLRQDFKKARNIRLVNLKTFSELATENKSETYYQTKIWNW